MAIRQYEGNDQLFLMACELAGVKKPIPRRQWTKWTQERGMAFSKKQEAQQALGKKS